MAITSNTSIKTGATALPDGYSPPALTPLSNAEDAEFTTDIAISNAHASNAETGLTQVLAAVESFFESDFAVNTLKLDVAKTIAANLLVTRIRRVNTAASIFLTGTEVFRCTVKVTYN